MTATSWRQRLVTWTVRLVLVGILGLVAIAVAILVVVPRATHGVAMTVLTGSMTPTIPVGSIVVDRPVDPGTLHVGDIATYQKEAGKAEFITHRIVKIDTSTTPSTYIFKGDANRGRDINPVPASAIRGKVWFHVRYLGAIRDMLHTKGGLAGVAMLLLAGYAFVQFGGGLRERKAAQPSHPSPVTALGNDPGSVAGLLSGGSGPVTRRVPILVTLPIGAFEGLAPQAVAVLLGGVLLDADATTFSVLVAETAERAPDTITLLKSFGPLSLQTAISGQPTELTDALTFETDLLALERDALDRAPSRA